MRGIASVRGGDALENDVSGGKEVVWRELSIAGYLIGMNKLALRYLSPQTLISQGPLLRFHSYGMAVN
jgi:hypothetical protein